jgi:hypothetical protein
LAAPKGRGIAREKLFVCKELTVAHYAF